MKLAKKIIIIFITFFTLVFVVMTWMWFYSDDLMSDSIIRKENKTVGVLMMGEGYGRDFEGLVKGMDTNGYFQNENIKYVVKTINGGEDAITEAANDLLKERIDLVYAISTPIAIVAKKTLSVKVPVVFDLVDDPVGSGLVKSYSGSEGNITGCSNLSAELSGKRLEIFKEAFPSIKRVVTFYDPVSEESSLSLSSLRQAADILDISVTEVEINGTDELKRVLASMMPGQYDGIYITPDVHIASNIGLVTDKAKQLGLPTMGYAESMAKSGVTLTYGASFYDMGLMCAATVNEVLGGKNISNIPLVTPSKLEIILNKKMLDDMQFDIDSGMISRADKIIQE